MRGTVSMLAFQLIFVPVCAHSLVSCDQRGKPALPPEIGLLFEIHYAQMRFNPQRDPSTNGVVHEFWRADVAGLYYSKDDHGQPRKLIDPRTAAADAHPTIRGADVSQEPEARFGYLLRQIELPEGGWADKTRFAVVAYPEVYPTTGRFTYVMNQSGIVYRKDLGRGGGVDRYPMNLVGESWDGPSFQIP